jgi:hypothetical protein
MICPSNIEPPLVGKTYPGDILPEIPGEYRTGWLYGGIYHEFYSQWDGEFWYAGSTQEGKSTKHIPKSKHKPPVYWYAYKPMGCQTCNGTGEIDETLGGEPFSNPHATCPDCNGRGY